MLHLYTALPVFCNNTSKPFSDHKKEQQTNIDLFNKYSQLHNTHTQYHKNNILKYFYSIKTDIQQQQKINTKHISAITAKGTAYSQLFQYTSWL